MVRALCVVLLGLAACDRATATGGDGGPSVDAGDAAGDLGVEAAADDVPSSGSACSFNRDCPEAERCACNEGACRCERGARGRGVAGETVCAGGNDCASGLCLEGNAGFLCSDACTTAGECPSALPRCVSIPTVGRVCARDPSMMTADAGSTPGCEGACATTLLNAQFGSRSATFVRAQHGVDAGRLHIEAHFGGDPACPNDRSPTPQRTLVLTGLRADATGPQSMADGVSATLFDFSGSLVSEPLVRATAVRATPRFLMPGVAVSWSIEITFSGGTVTGGLYAPGCESLN
ncbi:MAG: hypothetical protein JNK72_15435 [Myxococcales bacterium]|nr:hypothetical protein [Myxococcales bacterium]